MYITIRGKREMKYREITDKLNSLEPGNISAVRDYSVVMLTVDDDLIFEVRSDDIKRQPGEICFPGGMKEPGESYLECAVRETSEELGIDEDDIKIDAKLGTLTSYSRSAITVYIGKIERKVFDAMKPSRKEVKEIFTVPLQFFLDNEPELYYGKVYSEVDDFPDERVGFPDGYPWSVGNTEIPIYEYDGYVIWGITGRILKYFAERINEKW